MTLLWFVVGGIAFFFLGAVVGVVFGLGSWEVWLVFALAAIAGISTKRWRTRRPDGW